MLSTSIAIPIFIGSAVVKKRTVFNVTASAGSSGDDVELSDNDEEASDDEEEASVEEGEGEG